MPAKQAQDKHTSHSKLKKTAIAFLIAGIALYGIGLIIRVFNESDWVTFLPGLLGMAVFVTGLILITIYFVLKLASRKSEP